MLFISFPFSGGCYDTCTNALCTGDVTIAASPLRRYCRRNQ